MAAIQSGLTPAVLKKYKFVFLGDIAVGKTSIINQFMYGTFDQTHQATIGIDFLSKTMYLDDRTIRLQLWDTAGQERFRSLIPNYIRDCSVAIIVFDISQRSSFNSLEKWVQDVRNERGGDVVIMVAGNKIDLVDKRAVSPEDCETKAKELNVQYMEVSAKTGANIKQLFKALAQELPLAQETSVANPPDSSTGRVKLSDTPAPQQKTKEGKCC